MESPRLFTTLPIHLRAALIALLTTTVIVFAWMGFAIHLEHRWNKYLAPETSDLKNQGAVLQHAAFAAKDVLPLYGSSELVKKIPDRASLLFANYPSDFVVSPIGKGGNTSLIMAQKIAASAVSNRGHKLAIILSPSWFFVRTANRDHYDGNFSAMQCSDLLFNSPLSWDLKRDIARRMLYYPETLEKSSFLQFAVQRQAMDRPIDHVMLALARPLGWLQNGIFLLQDHTETALSILTDKHKSLPKPSSREPGPLPWDQLFEEATRDAKPDLRGPTESYARAFGDDQEFLRVLNNAHEWGDLELLLRTLGELHLDPLLISIPIQLKHFEDEGLSRASVEVYNQRLNALAEQYDVPVADFADHEEDSKFFADHHDHLTTRGWIYLDKAIDDFFHAPRRHLHPRRVRTANNNT